MEFLYDYPPSQLRSTLPCLPYLPTAGGAGGPTAAAGAAVVDVVTLSCIGFPYLIGS